MKYTSYIKLVFFFAFFFIGFHSSAQTKMDSLKKRPDVSVNYISSINRIELNADSFSIRNDKINFLGNFQTANDSILSYLLMISSFNRIELNADSVINRKDIIDPSANFIHNSVQTANEVSSPSSLLYNTKPKQREDTPIQNATPIPSTPIDKPKAKSKKRVSN